MTVLWRGSLFDSTGYSRVSRNIATRLIKSCCDISFQNIGQASKNLLGDVSLIEKNINIPKVYDTSITHSISLHFELTKTKYKKIGKTIHETDGLPKQFVHACNMQDELWLSTDFNINSFRNSGVKTRIVKVPHGIDCDMFKPNKTKHEHVKFLSIFEFGHRKGWDILLTSWADSFNKHDDVSLTLKTYSKNKTKNIGKIIFEHVNKINKNHARIDVITDLIPDDRISDLYNSHDVYVAPSRGEGWGCPQIEAMASGLPVIASRWGGHLEFMNDDVVSFIEIDKLIDVFPYERMCEPSVDSLSQQLKKLASDRKLRENIGLKARNHVLKNFSWDNTIRCISTSPLMGPYLQL